MSRSVSLPSRRELVATAAAAGAVSLATAAVAAPLSLKQGEAAPMGGASPASAQLAHWRRMIGTSFLASGRAGSANLTVVSVEALKRGPMRRGPHRPRAFAVLLEARGTRVPVEGGATSRFYHPAHGAFDLFLSGCSKGNGRTRFVAIFT